MNSRQENVEPLNPFLDIEIDTSKSNENNKFLTSHKQPHRLLEISTQQNPPATAESVCGVTSSDEERAAYADRRNGVGARLVPALQNKQQSKRNKTTGPSIQLSQNGGVGPSQNIHLQIMNQQTSLQEAPQSPQQQLRYTNETDFSSFKPSENLNNGKLFLNLCKNDN